MNAPVCLPVWHFRLHCPPGSARVPLQPLLVRAGQEALRTGWLSPSLTRETQRRFGLSAWAGATHDVHPDVDMHNQRVERTCFSAFSIT